MHYHRYSNSNSSCSNCHLNCLMFCYSHVYSLVSILLYPLSYYIIHILNFFIVKHIDQLSYGLFILI
ncbi:hypothetical protein NY2A_b578L [Paramecium bursaria Chlorella virus NY2A]|uniref:Uncharacterized protein b578L n=1 Tax=Paramecium bursaria Chlorella virus NY2A TaxID=46021 RepID=A7IXA3_PBCVN|nr:hypothetical protein NY2A_b578L [Paramecium bursaria Chlorella virus NY2A]ABT14977.1 hypothetical protein NY2A_b578L [Paramecium bursaria Chlorella virus NY2A]